MTNSSVSIESK